MVMRTVACLIVALVAGSAAAAVFQYRVPVATDRGEAEAFLWVSPKAPQVRGVVMGGGNTLMERPFMQDPPIRAACAEEGLALVFLTGGLGRGDLRQVLDDLAKASGYREVSVAPLLFVGHSAGGPQAKARAIQFADRCFGLVQHRGGAPGGQEPLPPGIPALMMVGQFDEFGGTMRTEEGREQWQGARNALAAYRAADERNLGSLVVEPGAGHFAYSPRNAAYLAPWLRKAAEARIPDWPADAAKPVTCRKVDHRSGWLTDLAFDEPATFPPAPYEEYRGEKSKAQWHFDREMAEATVAQHADGFGKKDQFIKWEDPHWVDAGARFFFTKITWVGDGQTFEVHPVYRDTYPSQYRGHGPKWARAGRPVGHADVPIHVKGVGGPVVAVGGHRLRIRYDGLNPATVRMRVTFLAYSHGDGTYRYTEHVGMLPRGFGGLTKGKDQTITFPPIKDLKADSPPVKLGATSDAGLPVEYYVAYGPAKIENGALKIAELPARSRFSIPVKVVAYQFGRGIEPLVKTAAPVERTFRIIKP